MAKNLIKPFNAGDILQQEEVDFLTDHIGLQITAGGDLAVWPVRTLKTTQPLTQTGANKLNDLVTSQVSDANGGWFKAAGANCPSGCVRYRDTSNQLWCLQGNKIPDNG